MKEKTSLLRQIETDIGLDIPFCKGQKITVRRCWHFSTDGNAVDFMFYDEQDFRDAMNRIYVVLDKYDVIILAFVLMDTHVHFILYGEFEDCKRFVHEFVARTSRHISVRHGETHKFESLPINYQKIDSDRYLKTAICYVIKNPPVAGLPFMAWNYPWSSGPLYFNCGKSWTMTPAKDGSALSELNTRERWSTLRSRLRTGDDPAMYDGIVLPGEYVAVDIVERLFKTARSYNYFLCISKEIDIESRAGYISRLSIPIAEMRQHKNELCRSMFGVESIKSLNTQQRISLARSLHRKFNSSPKQVIRLCGLVYDETKTLIVAGQ